VQVVTNETTRLVESILRQGTREELGNWRVIDLEQDAKRRLGGFVGLAAKPPSAYHDVGSDDKIIEAVRYLDTLERLASGE